MSPPRRVLRYDFRERTVHTWAAVTYVYLLLTGLAFWTPALFWIAVVLGGGYLSRLLHPWVGLFFAGAVATMYVQWRRDMRTTEEDRVWRRAMRHYVRNEDSMVPPAGRFNYGQKLFFWGMLWAAVVLLASGLALWFPAAFSGLPEFRELAILLHVLSALVAIGLFIIHVYMGVFVVPGSVDAIVRGTVPREWARHHHRLWADETSARPER